MNDNEKTGWLLIFLLVAAVLAFTVKCNMDHIDEVRSVAECSEKHGARECLCWVSGRCNSDG